MSNTMKENKMGTMPVNKLLINMALPMMISMLVQALYNIVDSIFVARISEEALTAVSMALPRPFNAEKGRNILALLSISILGLLLGTGHFILIISSYFPISYAL